MAFAAAAKRMIPKTMDSTIDRALMMMPARASPRPRSPVRLICVSAMIDTTRPPMLTTNARMKPTIARTLYRSDCAGACW
ncbi:hypothetical protein QP157_21385 [Sphingomonas sp. LR61]